LNLVGSRLSFEEALKKMSNLECRLGGPLPIESQIDARSGFKTFVILELARIGADTETQVSIRFFFFGISLGKKVQFTPYPLGSLSDDLPMEMTKLKLARHSSLTELCLAKIKHENIVGGSLVISSLT